MNNIVRAESGRVGGLRLDEGIMNYVRRKYNLSVGQPTAESIKIQVGAAVDQPEEVSMEIQGRDNVSGLPRMITITTGEVVEALAEPLSGIATVVKNVLGNTPPELASDIIDRGIMLTGGGAMLRGIDQYLTRETGVPVYRAENPLISVAVGAGRALEDPAILRRIVQGQFRY
jgi:rod shape-determining protein MreB